MDPVQAEQGSGNEPSPTSDPTPSRVLVAWKDGYLQVPHWLSDNFLPTLEPFEAIVYLRLYRLSHGFGRDWCEVGAQTLSTATKIKKTALFTAIRSLESKGLLAREAAATKARGIATNRYRVILPDVVKGPSGEPRPDGEQGARGGRKTGGGHMKGNQKESTNAPVAPASLSVYDIRAGALRIREAQQGTPGFELRGAVRSWLIASGDEVDEATITEAIRGMV